MAALALTSQADSRGARRWRAQAVGAGAGAATVKAGLPPSPQLLELPPLLLLLLPPPPPPLPQLHARGPPGGRASLPRSFPQVSPRPPRSMESELSGSGSGTQTLSGCPAVARVRDSAAPPLVRAGATSRERAARSALGARSVRWLRPSARGREKEGGC